MGVKLSIRVDQSHRNAYAGNYSWKKLGKQCKKSTVFIGKKRKKQKMRKNNITLEQRGMDVKLSMRVEQRHTDAYPGK